MLHKMFFTLKPVTGEGIPTTNIPFSSLLAVLVKKEADFFHPYFYTSLNHGNDLHCFQSFCYLLLIVMVDDVIEVASCYYM